MQRKWFIIPILALVLIGAPLVYAQTAESAPDSLFVEELINAGAGNAGTGAAAGFVMSLIAVLGKRLKEKTDKKEPVNLRLLLITVAIAGVVGWLAPLAGVTTNVTILGVIGITYIVNQTLRPILANWTTK